MNTKLRNEAIALAFCASVGVAAYFFAGGKSKEAKKAASIAGAIGAAGLYGYIIANKKQDEIAKVFGMNGDFV